MRFVYTLFIVVSFLYSDNLSSGAIKKLEFKGKKFIDIFCNKEKLPSGSSVDELVDKLKASNVCSGLDRDKLKAVAYFILSKKGSKFVVPKGAKCPVCGMIVRKYPKWAAHMVVDGKDYYFDGVKDMLKFYFFDENFKYNRDKISKVEVRDYYNLNTIDARNAYYVVNSNVYGPMGKELIAFKSKKEAESFIADHKGRVIKFQETTPNLIIELDK